MPGPKKTATKPAAPLVQPQPQDLGKAYVALLGEISNLEGMGLHLKDPAYYAQLKARQRDYEDTLRAYSKFPDAKRPTVDNVKVIPAPAPQKSQQPTPTPVPAPQMPQVQMMQRVSQSPLQLNRETVAPLFSPLPDQQPQQVALAYSRWQCHNPPELAMSRDCSKVDTCNCG